MIHGIVKPCLKEDLNVDLADWRCTHKDIKALHFQTAAVAGKK